LNTKILIIDDDLIAIPHVASELRLEGFQVDAISTSKQIAKLLAKRGAFPADFLVLDLMLVVDLYSPEEAHHGLFTGLLLARDVRAKWQHVPILIWSAAPLKRVREVAAEFTKQIDNCRFLSKGAPIAEAIKSYFKHGRFVRGWAERLWESMTIRPSIGGVAVDIKKLRDS
jgi:CheY-like chemotaxis protein